MHVAPRDGVMRPPAGKFRWLRKFRRWVCGAGRRPVGLRPTKQPDRPARLLPCAMVSDERCKEQSRREATHWQYNLGALSSQLWF